MTVEEMSIRMSNEQVALMRSMISTLKQRTCFELEGIIFIGNGHHAAMEFAYNNPTGGDFYVWCQDHYKILGKA